MTHLIGWVDGATYTDSEGNEISYEPQTLLIADMFKDSVSLSQIDEDNNPIDPPYCLGAIIYTVQNDEATNILGAQVSSDKVNLVDTMTASYEGTERTEYTIIVKAEVVI